MIDGLLFRGVLRRGGDERVVTRDGFSVRTVRLPGASGRTIVFVPPLGEAWTAWAQPMFRLSALGACVALDPPVLVEPGAAPDLAARVLALLAVVEDSGPDPVVAVGASIGGLVAMRAARRRPGTFRRVLATALRPDLEDLSGIRSEMAVASATDARRYLERTWHRPPPTSPGTMVWSSAR